MKEPVVPFCTYDFQDELISAIDEAITVGVDLVAPKSRDMGATWSFLGVFTHRFLFRENQNFLAVSRKEGYVEADDNPDSLFWKVDFLLARLPAFMHPTQPGYRRTELHFSNRLLGNTIDGESTTGDIARGGRRTAILLDEFASVEQPERVLAATADATRCRLFNSSVRPRHAFMRLCENPNIKVINLPWWKHPVKAQGLYRTLNGKIEVLDTAFKFPPDYPFVMDREGKYRSAWYDSEAKRRTSKREMAQEIDMDSSAGASFFDGEVLARMEEELCREPDARGDMVYRVSPKDGRVDYVQGFEPDYGRRSLALWFKPKPDGTPEQGRDYIIGVDVAAGTGASNSAISVVDKLTGEKVAEFADPLTSPEDLGRLAVALCKWFGGVERRPLLIWEENGPGAIFGREIMRVQRYRPVYMRRNESDDSPKAGTKPGWFTGTKTKLVLLGAYRRKLARGTYLNRSRPALAECRQYEYMAGGGVGIVDTSDADDPSGARDQHGDRVVADALCAFLLPEVLTAGAPVSRIEYGSPAWRREQVQAKRRAKETW